MQTPHRILVIRGGAIGDFILTLPAIRALRELQPSTPNRHLEILGYPRIANLACAAGLADATRSIESPSLLPFFTMDCPLSGEAVSYFKSFDLILSYIHDSDGIFQHRVRAASPALYLRGPHRPVDTEGIHATEALLQPLRTLGIQTIDPRPQIILPGHSPAPLQSGRQWLAAHPGSGSERKNWPEANWASLLVKLAAATPWNFLLIGGEAEGDRLQRLASQLPGDRIQIAQNIPLTDLAHRIKRCTRFIGHDSGISHLASALGIPVLALWGESAVEVWRPLGPNATILRDPAGLRSLSVDAVLTAL